MDNSLPDASLVRILFQPPEDKKESEEQEVRT